MYKTASNKEKYAALQKWLPGIIDSVKKDLKNEHLRKDFAFIKKYFGSKNLNKITVEEMTDAYEKAIAQEEAGEALGEFITSRWLLKNSELYEFFERELTRINPNFTELEEIDLPTAQLLVKNSTEHFGAPATYIFSVLNSVVFPAEVFHQLEKSARHQKETHDKESDKISEKMTVDSMQKNFEKEMARLTDKYEKKLAGLQKKYLTDTEGLKKQVAQLQRKLHEKTS